MVRAENRYPARRLFIVPFFPNRIIAPMQAFTFKAPFLSGAVKPSVPDTGLPCGKTCIHSLVSSGRGVP
jgi:hypothetical protein